MKSIRQICTLSALASLTWGAAGCLDHDLPAGEGSSAQRTFIAQQRDFSDFRDWERFELTNVESHADVNGPVSVYISALPKGGSKEFPVGTRIVKVVEDGEPTNWTLHAMAKRGGDFNGQGALGWEFFELKLNAEDTPILLWRGEAPPDGSGYGVLAGSATEAAMEADCNSCHISNMNDAVLNDALILKDL